MVQKDPEGSNDMIFVLFILQKDEDEKDMEEEMEDSSEAESNSSSVSTVVV